MIGGEKKPVTGDYDLWMVAPSRTRLAQHLGATLERDSHGESAATPYITALLPRLNAVCGRSRNPVFRHGAESQNYAFTQALDLNLALFTPGGGRRMISQQELVRALYEMRMHGYLVYWNKRYGEQDPHLMGEAAAKADLDRMTSIQASLQAFVRANTARKQLNSDARSVLAVHVEQHLEEHRSTCSSSETSRQGGHVR